MATQITGLDSNVEAVIAKHIKRAQHGMKKYNVSTDRKDLTMKEWLQHAQDEAMDAAIYLQKLMSTVDEATLSKKL